MLITGVCFERRGALPGVHQPPPGGSTGIPRPKRPPFALLRCPACRGPNLGGGSPARRQRPELRAGSRSRKPALSSPGRDPERCLAGASSWPAEISPRGGTSLRARTGRRAPRRAPFPRPGGFPGSPEPGKGGSGARGQPRSRPGRHLETHRPQRAGDLALGGEASQSAAARAPPGRGGMADARPGSPAGAPRPRPATRDPRGDQPGQSRRMQPAEGRVGGGAARTPLGQSARPSALLLPLATGAGQPSKITRAPRGTGGGGKRAVRASRQYEAFQYVMRYAQPRPPFSLAFSPLLRGARMEGWDGVGCGRRGELGGRGRRPLCNASNGAAPGDPGKDAPRAGTAAPTGHAGGGSERTPQVCP